MTRPTHILADGSAVYPEGYDPADIKPLPKGYWTKRDLAEAKGIKWQQTKKLRAKKIAAGVHVTGIGVFQSDTSSRAAISEAAFFAASDPDFEDSFTLDDNAVVTLSAGEMVAVGKEIRAHVSSCHARARDIRGQIDGAATMAALEAIDITIGW